MLPVLLYIFFTDLTSATYYLNQQPPNYLSNRIDRPLGYGVGGAGVYPPPNPPPQNLFGGLPGAFPPVVQRVPVPFAYPRPSAGIRPVPLSAPPSNQQAVSDLLSLLTSQIQNNLAASSDIYDAYEEKGQSDTEKLSSFRNNIGVYPTGKLRTAFPGAIIRSALGNGEENTTIEKEEDDLKQVLTLSNVGTGPTLIQLSPPTDGVWNQVLGNGLPTGSGVPLISVKVVPQGASTQTQTKQTAAEVISSDQLPGGEEYTLQVNGGEGQEPEFHLVTAGSIDSYPEGVEPLGEAEVQSGTGTSNSAAVLGLRKIPFHRPGDIFLVPSGFRFSKSIPDDKAQDVVTAENTANSPPEGGKR